MKKYMHPAGIIFVFFLVSFGNPPKKISTIEPGAFSLGNGCVLDVRSDKVFVYSDGEQQIQGKWEIIRGDLILETASVLPISRKWKIDQNGKCLKSRMKFAFYRICNC
jgi:hypothetical protein